MKNPLVSIIVPVYNVEAYLHKCLDSIVNQTYKNIEIVLVEDGSKDSSGEICDEYASSDSRIIVIHKHNEGVAQARIDGFNNSKGELITFIDADDYVDLQFIEKLVEPFEQYNIDLCTCENRLVYKKLNERVFYPKRSIHGYYDRKGLDEALETQYLWDKNLYHAGLPVYLVTKMIKRNYVLDALKTAQGLWWGEDQVASFHILTHIYSMYALSEGLYYYVKYDDNRQASSKYNYTLWVSQLECWKKHQLLDSKGLLFEQLPTKMWWTFIHTFKHMARYVNTYSSFKRDMKMFDNDPMWKEMLHNKSLPKGKREKLAFFFLRNKIYYPFYKILLHRL